MRRGILRQTRTLPLRFFLGLCFGLLVLAALLAIFIHGVNDLQAIYETTTTPFLYALR